MWRSFSTVPAPRRFAPPTQNHYMAIPSGNDPIARNLMKSLEKLT
jgi:hypothetical protein